MGMGKCKGFHSESVKGVYITKSAKDWHEKCKGLLTSWLKYAIFVHTIIVDLWISYMSKSRKPPIYTRLKRDTGPGAKHLRAMRKRLSVKMLKVPQSSKRK